MAAPKKKTWIALSAGAVGGAIECCATWPMEYIKTQLQSFRTVAGGPRPPFAGIASGRYTVATTGVLSLYNGLAPTLAFAAPKAGVRFGANQFFRNRLADPATGHVSMGKSFLAGLCAGICEATLVVTPQETIKTKLINLNMGLVDGVPHLLKAEGVAGVYAGLASTCMKQGGNQGSRFLFMAQWRKVLSGDAEAKLPAHLTFLGGLGAGLFSVLATAPFDVVKTRMQSKDAKNYASTPDCFRQIATREGPRAFFNGALARAARVVPGQGIIFVCVDLVYDAIARASSAS